MTYRTFNVSVGIDELIDLDLEGFLDLLGERVGNPLLKDISYKAVGLNGAHTIVFEVEGDDSDRDEETA